MFHSVAVVARVVGQGFQSELTAIILFLVIIVSEIIRFSEGSLGF